MSASRVERLGLDGDGVVVDPTGPIFVRTALPGDVVLLGKPRRDGKIRRAELKKVIEPSPDRQPGPCAIAARCGGCPLMHASERACAAFKETAVRHALGALPFTLTVPATVGYRTRARLAFAGRSLGYRMPGSRAVLDVPACVVLAPALADALAWLREALLPLLSGAGDLHLGSAETGDRLEAVLAIATDAPQPPALYRALEDAVARGALSGAEASIAGSRARFGDPIERSRDVDGRLLEVPVGGFRQAHVEANRLLGRAVLELGAPEGKRVLELHAGHGNFTLPLASRAASVHAVELGDDAASALRANLARHALEASVEAGDAAAITRSLRRGTYDLAVIDPPRTGAKDLMAPLAALAPARIVYVSCAPGPLARDLAMLRDGGYAVTAAQAFDLFPRTAHVETVVRLERAAA